MSTLMELHGSISVEGTWGFRVVDDAGRGSNREEPTRGGRGC